MRIELNDDMLDKVVSAKLLSSIKGCYEFITELRALTDLQDFEKIDLEDTLRDYEYLVGAYKYYTIRSEWVALEKYAL